MKDWTTAVDSREVERMGGSFAQHDGLIQYNGFSFLLLYIPK